MLATIVSSALGSTALVEKDLMTTSYLAGASRFIIIIGLILFVCFHVRRLFDNKEIEVILSRPISRNQFILAYGASFVMLALLICLPLMVILKLFTIAAGKGLWIFAVSIFFEAIIMSGFAMLASLILKSGVAAVLSSVSFYLLARMMGFFMATVASAPLYLPKLEQLLHWLSEVLLLIVSIIFPRFDLFGKTSWLIYDQVTLEDLTIVCIQAAIYIPLLLFASMIDFNRKQF
jgi:hypothetical protein